MNYIIDFNFGNGDTMYLIRSILFSSLENIKNYE